MKFSEWWGKVVVRHYELFGDSRVRSCCHQAFNQGLKEGLRRAQVASESLSQGVGSHKQPESLYAPWDEGGSRKSRRGLDKP